MNHRLRWSLAGLLAVVIVGVWIAARRGNDHETVQSVSVPTPRAQVVVRPEATRVDGREAAAIAKADMPTDGIASARSGVVSKRFPHGRVREERLETIAPGRERWCQWIETEGPFPNVRADLVFKTKGGVVSLVEETYYLADSVLVERPSDLSPDQFAERLNRLGLNP